LRYPTECVLDSSYREKGIERLVSDYEPTNKEKQINESEFLIMNQQIKKNRSMMMMSSNTF
jgi:hypothetical protein